MLNRRGVVDPDTRTCTVVLTIFEEVERSSEKDAGNIRDAQRSPKNAKALPEMRKHRILGTRFSTQSRRGRCGRHGGLALRRTGSLGVGRNRDTPGSRSITTSVVFRSNLRRRLIEALIAGSWWSENKDPQGFWVAQPEARRSRQFDSGQKASFSRLNMHDSAEF
jgi:hypothetical protein